MQSLFSLRTKELLQSFSEFLAECEPQVDDLSKAILQIFLSGKKLLICGNGGSAADAQHLAAEFVSSFMMGLNRKSLPAIALTTDTSIISAIGNDFDFELIFSRQVEGLGIQGDGLIAISTSGESKNCIRAAEVAKEKGLKVLALTRKNSTLMNLCDVGLGVPSTNTQHIQEFHLISYHIIVEIVEDMITKGIK